MPKIGCVGITIESLSGQGHCFALMRFSVSMPSVVVIVVNGDIKSPIYEVIEAIYLAGGWPNVFLNIVMKAVTDS